MVICYVRLYIIEIKVLQWAKDCICNAGKMCFDAIEFGTKSSRIEIICGKCRGIICWWLINTEQFMPLASCTTKKLSPIVTRTSDQSIR